MLELKEASENVLFCAPKLCHLRTGTRATEHRNERDNKQLAEVMTGIASPRIGDAAEGVEENLHDRRLQDDETTIQNPSRQQAQPAYRPSQVQKRFSCTKLKLIIWRIFFDSFRDFG